MKELQNQPILQTQAQVPMWNPAHAAPIRPPTTYIQQPYQGAILSNPYHPSPYMVR